MPRLLLAALLVLLAATPVAAHKLKVFAAAIGDHIEGRVYFVGGGAAIGVPVTLTGDDATVLASTATTAPDGNFVLPLTSAGAVTITADAQDGHVAEFVLGASPAAAAPAATTASAPVDAAALDAAIARQVAPLADEIDALRDSVGLRDIIGGVGYILGAFGLWAFLAARRKR